jgi:hypothetical protein
MSQKIQLGKGGGGGYDDDYGTNTYNGGNLGAEGGSDFSATADRGDISGYLLEKNPEKAVQLLRTERGFSASPEEAASLSINKKKEELRNKIKTALSKLSGQRDAVKVHATELKQYKGSEEEADKYLDMVEHSFASFEMAEIEGRKWLIGLCIFALINFAMNVYMTSMLLQSDKPYTTFKASYDAAVANSSFSMLFVVISMFFITKGCSLKTAATISIGFMIITIVCSSITYFKMPASINIPDMNAYVISLFISMFYSLLIILWYVFKSFM